MAKKKATDDEDVDMEQADEGDGAGDTDGAENQPGQTIDPPDGRAEDEDTGERISSADARKRVAEQRKGRSRR
jgi:hypothetical protein